MTTRRAVVADDVYATINDRRWELEGGLREGTLDPQKVLSGLQQLIESCSWPKFSVWRTIRHVGKRNAESYRAGLAAVGCRVSEWANDLLGRFETTSIDEEVDLGLASVADIGFKEATRYDVICSRIMVYGGTLCLPEDGPVLREQYLDQPMNERVRLAMNPIRDAFRDLIIFSVEHGGHGLWLDRYCGYPVDLWHLDDWFVFRLSKRPLVL